MKKLISVTLAILILVTAVFSFPASAEEECEHEYESTYYFHHPYDGIEYDTWGNCLDGGYIEYTCTKCGDSTKEYHDSFEHDICYRYSQEETCTVGSYDYYSCKNCGYCSYREYHSEASGHDYVEINRFLIGEYYNDVFDDNGGHLYTITDNVYEVTKECSVCGNTTTTTETESVYPHVHNYATKNIADSAGCMQMRYCTECDYSETYESDDCHDCYINVRYLEWQAEYECESVYYIEKECYYCDYSFEGFAAEGHNLKTKTQGCCEIEYCTKCNYSVNTEENHNYVQISKSTCVDEIFIDEYGSKFGYITYECTECGNEKKSYEFYISHVRGDVVETVDSTCTASGYTIYKCALCETEFKKYISPHHYELVAETEATCGSEGRMYYECKDCGDSYSEPIPQLLEHTEFKTYSYVTNYYLNPCLYTVETSCKNCGIMISTKQEYKHKENVFEKASTCDSFGYTASHCVTCGSTKSYTTSKPTGHTYSAVETTDPLGKKHTLYCCDDCSHYNGDLNSDSRVDLKDLVKMKKELANLTSNTVYDSRDCTQDGLLNSLDLTYLRKTILGTLK